jgi:hypothetical protein
VQTRSRWITSDRWQRVATEHRVACDEYGPCSHRAKSSVHRVLPLVLFDIVHVPIPMGVNSEYDGTLPRKICSACQPHFDGIPYLSGVCDRPQGLRARNERLVLICERTVLTTSRLSTLRVLRIHLGTCLQRYVTGRPGSGINSNQRLLVAMSNRCSGLS